MRTTRTIRLGVLALCAGAFASVSQGAVLSGVVTDWAGADGPWITDPFIDNALVIGDGNNSVVAAWTFATWNWDPDPEFPAPRFSAWFYATNLSLVGGPFDSMDVAWAEGITDVSQIADASIFDFIPAPEFSPHVYYPHMFADAQSNDGSIGSTHDADIGDFLMIRNAETGHYGVLRVDLIHTFDTSGRPYAHMDATWWFQTDGSGDFSSVPAPGATMLLGIAGMGVLRRKR